MILSRELAQHQLGVVKAEWLTIAEPQLGSADNAGSGLLVTGNKNTVFETVGDGRWELEHSLTVWCCIHSVFGCWMGRSSTVLLPNGVGEIAKRGASYYLCISSF